MDGVELPGQEGGADDTALSPVIGRHVRHVGIQTTYMCSPLYVSVCMCVCICVYVRVKILSRTKEDSLQKNVLNLRMRTTWVTGSNNKKRRKNKHYNLV